MLVAPRKASRASSSSESTRTDSPDSSSTASSNSRRFFADRTAAVATTRVSLAPSSPASRPCVDTTSAISAIFSEGMRPFDMALPMLVKARWVISSRSRSSLGSATRRRVVLLPMSMQA